MPKDITEERLFSDIESALGAMRQWPQSIANIAGEIRGSEATLNKLPKEDKAVVISDAREKMLTNASIAREGIASMAALTYRRLDTVVRAAKEDMSMSEASGGGGGLTRDIIYEVGGFRMRYEIAMPKLDAAYSSISASIEAIEADTDTALGKDEWAGALADLADRYSESLGAIVSLLDSALAALKDKDYENMAPALLGFPPGAIS